VVYPLSCRWVGVLEHLSESLALLAHQLPGYFGNMGAAMPFRLGYLPHPPPLTLLPSRSSNSSLAVPSLSRALYTLACTTDALCPA